METFFLSERASDWLAFAHFGAEQGERGGAKQRAKLQKAPVVESFQCLLLNPFIHSNKVLLSNLDEECKKF